MFFLFNVTTQILQNENRKKCKVEVENNFKNPFTSLCSFHLTMNLYKCNIMGKNIYN